MSTNFSLPPLIDSNIPSSSENNFDTPEAALRLRDLIRQQEHYSSDTDPSNFSMKISGFSLYTNNNNKVKIPVPPPSSSSSTTTNDNNTNNEQQQEKEKQQQPFIRRRTSLVREAARFVEDPTSFLQVEGKNNNQLESQSLIPQHLLLKRGEFDTKSSLLSQNDSYVSAVMKNLSESTAADEKLDLASQRFQIENLETTQRNYLIEKVFPESWNLLQQEINENIQEHFEELFIMECENKERRQRLQITGIEFSKEFQKIEQLEYSDLLLIEFKSLWRRGLNKWVEVLDLANLDGFVLHREVCTRRLQRAGRAFFKRRHCGQERFSLLQNSVKSTFEQEQQQFEKTSHQLRNRYQLHTCESFEQTSRRFLTEKSFKDLFRMHFKLKETLIILGEYDGRRQILAQEQKIACGTLLNDVNVTRYEQFHQILSERCKLVIQRRFDGCLHVRKAVLVLQNLFFRKVLKGEFGISFSKKWILDGCHELDEASPVRAVVRMRRKLKKQLEEEEEEETKTKTNEKNIVDVDIDADDEEQQKRQEEEKEKREKECEIIHLCEDSGRNYIQRYCFQKLKVLFELCFDEHFALLVGASTINNNYIEEILEEQKQEQKQEQQKEQQQQEEEQHLSTSNQHNNKHNNKLQIQLEFKFCSSISKWKTFPSYSSSENENEEKRLLLLPHHHLSPTVLRKSKTLQQFLSPFKELDPIDFEDPEWYRLRGAVDVSVLIAEAFPHKKSSEIYARTVGQLIRKRRATSAEIRQVKLRHLEQQAMQRLSCEMDEWNSRWIDAIQMLQEHSYMLLNFDWQRKWSDLKRYNDEDEVAIIQYMATQDYDSYRRDVNQVLKGVHRAVVKAAEERDYVPPQVKKWREEMEEFEKQQQQQQQQLQIQEKEEEKEPNFYDESDDEETEQVLDFWQHLLQRQQEQVEKHLQKEQEQEEEVETRSNYSSSSSAAAAAAMTEKEEEEIGIINDETASMYSEDSDEDILARYGLLAFTTNVEEEDDDEDDGGGSIYDE